MAGLRCKEKPKKGFAFSTRPKSTPMPATVLAPLPKVVSGHDDNPSIVPAESSTQMSSANMVTYTDLSDQLILPPTKSSYTLHLSSLEGCIVDYRQASGRVTALHAKGLRKCILLRPDISGSAMLSDLQDCLIVLGSHQVWPPSPLGCLY